MRATMIVPWVHAPRVSVPIGPKCHPSCDDPLQGNSPHRTYPQNPPPKPPTIALSKPLPQDANAITHCHLIQLPAIPPSFRRPTSASSRPLSHTHLQAVQRYRGTRCNEYATYVPSFRPPPAPSSPPPVLLLLRRSSRQLKRKTSEHERILARVPPTSPLSPAVRSLPCLATPPLSPKHALLKRN